MPRNRPAAGTPPGEERAGPATGRPHNITDNGHSTDLDVARALIHAGVPIFVAPPDPATSTGYRLPTRWQHTKPDPGVVDRWRPGWALCAVTGHLLDLVDIDPRNGGDRSERELRAAGLWPRAYAQAATPSGGRHDFVQVLGVHSRDNFRPGIDIKAGVAGDGQGFAFIPPTVRRSKVTGEPVAYRWLTPPDLDALDGGDTSGEALADLLEQMHGTGNGHTTGWTSFELPDRIAVGARDETLWRYACSLRGKGVKVTDAVRAMREAWKRCEQPPDDPYSWEDALEKIDRAWGYDYTPTPEPPPTSTIDDETSTPGSWSPVDLTPYLDGKITRPEPTVGLIRSDGLRLLYPGKEHTVIGEMESGKSWFACGCCAAELTAGRPVLYIHFEEADPGDTIERLQALGVRNDIIAALFTFVGPDRPVTGGELARLLIEPRPSLVVLDGVNEAMSLHGLKVREEDGAATFRRVLVKPCTAVGAASLAADHVVKDRERRGRDALGSVHKGNGLTGALILLENAEPFGRDLRGRSHLFITKDRPGHLRRNGRASGIPGKTFLGELVVDDTRTLFGYLDLKFWAPVDRTSEQPVDQDDADDQAVLAAVTDLAAAGKPASLRTIRAGLKGMGKDRVDYALTRLTLDDRLIETAGPRNARLFTVAATVAGDQQ
jgi:AAA domain